MIIQGGMGVAVSSWNLARAVSMQGQLGVVSGTAMDQVLVRRLWDGDPGGHMRRAVEAFPIVEIAEEILEKFFRPEGSPEAPYPAIPLLQKKLRPIHEKLLTLGNFVEVYLAKEGHDGIVGCNLLTKIQLPTLPSLYGALLAGADYVLMGAGIPREIPGALDSFAEHRPASLSLDVQGLDRGEVVDTTFEPMDLWSATPPDLTRPDFLPIISSHSLATMMTKKANGRVDGFVVEHHTAGGHNAPPRGKGSVNERGEPLYGDRDLADLEKIAEVGLPFWLAGGAGTPEALQAALSAGAAGVQVGTLFAYCEESGLLPKHRRTVIDQALHGELDVLTDGRASPTGFPFKVVQLDNTMSTAEDYEARERVCDLGYLRSMYKMEGGRIGYRCASEPVDTFVKKGGDIDDTVGRKCICNGLLATIGYGQLRDDGRELPILTSGDELKNLATFLGRRTSYSARDVIDYILGDEGVAGGGPEATEARQVFSEV
jgi:NAD(P)H-dependent flavin oxidoreductase YrpB (nitropropane dioxygenase family)